MEPGLFQMLEGTNVICDETGMEPGKIEKNGLQNIRALAELIEDQKVAYDFQYMHQDFQLSASVLIMSNESRSMFKNALWVPVKSVDDATGMTDNRMKEILAD